MVHQSGSDGVPSPTRNRGSAEGRGPGTPRDPKKRRTKGRTGREGSPRIEDRGDGSR